VVKCVFAQQLGQNLSDMEKDIGKDSESDLGPFASFQG